MWVTAYTDASFRDPYGTWAVWLRSDVGRIVLTGHCPETVTNSTQAELYAALMAVELSLGRWPATHGITVYSDCQSVVEGLLPSAKPFKSKECRSLQSAINALVVGPPVIRLNTKFVRGHQKGDKASVWINNKVDELASVRQKGNKYGSAGNSTS